VYCLALSLLLVAALIDLDTTLLPDELTFPLIGLGLVAAWLHWTPVSLNDSALGALFGYFSLWAVAYGYKLLRGVQGMAEGDFRLLAGLGALLGWQMLFAIILLSSCVGAVVGVFLILAKGHQREVPIPFGPYLAGGGMVALFFGTQLTRWLPLP
jgi:leader peptidase (prepilin peptidase)/N-methyltransferase